MKNLLIRFAASESGVTAVEYALVAGFIILAIFAVVGAIGTGIATNFYGPLAAGFN
jgi:Flp pilus assembly pilin Flp